MPAKPDVKNADVIRTAYGAMAQSLTAAMDMLDEPWKSQFQAVKHGLDHELEGLPPTDQIPAALAANSCLQSVHSALCQVNACFSGYMGQIASLRTSLNAAPTAASVATAIEAEVAKRMQDGKLFDAAGVEVQITAALSRDAATKVPKAELQSLCAVAKTEGIAEGRRLQKQEMDAAAAIAKKVDERKTALSTASIPLPLADLEKLLGGADDEFNAAKTKAEARLTELKELGVSNCALPVFGKVWGDDATFTEFRELCKSFVSAEKPDPFAVGGGTAALSRAAATGRPAIPAMIA